MKITKEQIKPFVKRIIVEMARRRGGASGEHDIEDVEVDGQTIGNIIRPEHMLKFGIRVEYDATPGCPGRYYGPPENCYPDEPAEVETTNVYMTNLEISPPKSQNYIQVNLERLQQKFPQVYLALNKVAQDYVDNHWSDIQNDILEKLGDPTSWNEPDYDDRDDQ